MDATPEKLLFCQNRDGGSAAFFIENRGFYRIQPRGDGTPGGRGPFNLRNHRDPWSGKGGTKSFPAWQAPAEQALTGQVFTGTGWTSTGQVPTATWQIQVPALSR